MRFIIILLALGAIAFLAREQLSALMPAAPAEPGKKAEYVTVEQGKSAAECDEAMRGEADEEAIARCSRDYKVKLGVGF